MTTFTAQVEVQGFKNELFTVEGTNELEGLTSLKQEISDSGYEPRHYKLKRVTAGTRKSSWTIFCLFSPATMQFKSAF